MIHVEAVSKRFGAVRALDSYDWRSDEARATFEQIKQMLQREVLDAQFAGMKRMLEDGDPEAMQAVKDMLADLNGLLRFYQTGCIEESIEIDLPDWRRRGMLQQWGAEFAKLLSPLL